jgi:HK97 family phage portal protein
MHDPTLADYWGGGSRSGQVVSQESSMTLGAVFAAVTIRAMVSAMLPLTVFQKIGSEQESAESHPAYRVLTCRPNDLMTPLQFWKMIEIYRLLWGNGYAEIEWDGGGNVRGLHLIEPWRCAPWIDLRGQLRYVVDGKMPGVHPDDMLHVMFMSTNGYIGRSMISWGRETIGLGLGAKEYGASFFGGGGKPTGVLEHPSAIGDVARKNIRAEWMESLRDPTGNRIAMLWEGMKYTPISIPPEDAQFIATSGMSVVDVARFAQVPPHLLYHFDGQPYNSLEQLGGEFLTYSLAPELTAREQEINRKLLNPPKLFCKYDTSALNKGDTAAQAAEDGALFALGSRSINEIRRKRGENGIGPDGDKYFVNAATIPLTRALTITDPVPIAPSGDNTPKQPVKPKPSPAVKKAGLAVAAETMGRLIRKEVKAAERASLKPDDFLSWMDQFYLAHEKDISEAMASSLSLLAEIDGEARHAGLLAKTHCLSSRNGLLKASEVSRGLLSASVEACCSTWENDRSYVLLGA